MYTALFFVYGLMQLGLFVWLLRIWRETREPVALLLILPQFFLVWDNWRVAAGPLLGFGDVLYWLTWPSFWIHWFAGCWLIIASGAGCGLKALLPQSALADFPHVAVGFNRWR